MSYTGAVNYLELNQNSTQTISANTPTAVQFPNSVKNTFGTNITISGTGNTTFTNASGKDMFITVGAVYAVDTSSASQTALWGTIKTTRAVGNNAFASIFIQDTVLTNTQPCSISAPFFLANGDSFQVIADVNGSTKLGTSSAVHGQAYKTTLTVTQIPGV